MAVWRNTRRKKGIRWKVGNGDIVKVYQDPWLPFERVWSLDKGVKYSMASAMWLVANSQFLSPTTGYSF